MGKWIRILRFAILVPVVGFAAVWACSAIWFDGPGSRTMAGILSAGIAGATIALFALVRPLLKGMIPLLFDAFFAAMAVTIIAGLVFATVLTMIVLPVFYSIIVPAESSD